MKMKGGGFYDRHSSIQADTNVITIPLMVNAVKELRLPDNGVPMTLVDYGSSEGKNSVALAKAAIETIRSRKREQPIVVVHEDIYKNDFNTLFHNMYENNGYNGDGSLYLFTSGTTFFKQLMPNASVHVASSCWAVQHLSQMPKVDLKDHIVYGADEDTRGKMGVQADKDWTTFLTHRAAELISGGKLVVALPAHRTPDPSVIRYIDVMNEILQDLVKEGKVDKKAYEDFVCPFYLRTKEEALRPLSGDSPVAGKFTVDYAEQQTVQSSLYSDLLETGDAEYYAKGYAGWVRAWSEWMLQHHIFGGVEASKASAALDELYRRMEARVRANPKTHVMGPAVLFLVFTRV